MARLLNDDRVGRALDELFSSDRASLLTALSLRAIRRYGIDVSELHNDSTSITLYGAYRDAHGTARAGVAPPVPERGFSKDHRGDLKQLVEILTISSDGAVPIAHRLADGSTEDSTTHIATGDQLVAMLGTTDFLYTADCKLATRDNMEHIATEAGRFLTILPRSRKEDEVGRASIAAGAVAWEEIARRPGKRKDDPDGVYLAAEAPSCSAEGYRIVWIRSSDKRRHDAAIRSDRIDRARIAVGELDESLRSKRSRLRTQSAVEEAVAAILTETGADRWVKVTVTDTADDEHRQERRGRPGKDTRYRRIERHRFSVSITTDAEAVSYDAASDGCFPFRHQRHAHPSRAAPQLQVPALFRAPLRNVQGGDRGGASHPRERRPPRSLAFCLYVALLVHALVERDLRRAMAAKGIASLPMYHEGRPCVAPTAARVIELLEPLSATGVLHANELLTMSPPEPDALQRQILSLLKVPLRSYGIEKQPPRYSR